MKLTKFLFLYFCYFQVQGQYIPNSNFENFSSCPTALSELSKCSSWTQPTTGTTDFYNCAFYTNGFLSGTPSSGSGVVGLWSITSSIPANSYGEYAKAMLLSPLKKDSTYCITFDVMYEPNFFSFFGATVNSCVDYGIYIYNDTAVLPVLGGASGIYDVNAQAATNASNILINSYKTFSYTYTALGGENAIMLGAFTNSNTIIGSCASGGDKPLYVNVDNLTMVLCNSTPPCDSTIYAYGPVCDSSIAASIVVAEPGGMFSGTGITDAALGIFSPSVAGPGSHVITYTTTCGNFDTILITVNALDNATFSYSSLFYCVPDSMNPTPQILGDTGGIFSVDNDGIIDSVTGNLDITANGAGIYNVDYLTNGICSASKTAKITVNDCASQVYYIPNVFTPNTDGLNDQLYVLGNPLDDFNLKIYDRWGNKVFDTNNQDAGWDGRKDGKELNSAVYIYYLQASFNKANIFDSGNITLIR